jgi:hypothetical protein
MVTEMVGSEVVALLWPAADLVRTQGGRQTLVAAVGLRGDTGRPGGPVPVPMAGHPAHMAAAALQDGEAPHLTACRHHTGAGRLAAGMPLPHAPAAVALGDRLVDHRGVEVGQGVTKRTCDR